MAEYRQSPAYPKSLLINEEEAVFRARCDGALLRKRDSPTLIDLFCGAGGMTLGFTKLSGQRFDPVWFSDLNQRCSTNRATTVASELIA